jgi:WW domain
MEHQVIQFVEYIDYDNDDDYNGDDEVVEFVEQYVRPSLKRRSSSRLLHPEDVGLSLEQASVEYQFSYQQQERPEPAPLPEGWSEHYCPNWKEYYYYNMEDGTSTWERPEPDAVVNGGGSVGSDDDYEEDEDEEESVEEEVVYVDEEEWEWGDDQTEVVEMVEEYVGSYRRSAAITVQPHEVGIGVELADKEVECHFIESDDSDDEEEEIVQVVRVLRPSLLRRRSSMTIRPEEVGIGEPQDQPCIYPIPLVQKKKQTRFHSDDSVSLTSITSRSMGSESEHPIRESLGAKASLRLSLVAAKAVVKLREKLVTAQLRDRLREHRKHFHPDQSSERIEKNMDVPIIINVHQEGGGCQDPWAEIIGAISTAAKKLKPVPKHQKRDSSTYVNQDHPYMRELRQVQAQVLPVWRSETYSYWI